MTTFLLIDADYIVLFLHLHVLGGFNSSLYHKQCIGGLEEA